MYIGNHRIEEFDMNGNFIVTIKIPSIYGREKSCKNATEAPDVFPPFAVSYSYSIS
jgi:hypothetical protein